MKKQSTLFPVTEVPIIQELDLIEAEKVGYEVKAAVEAHCYRIEVAGSIRRQKAKVHDVDFVVVSQSDVQWKKINEKLKLLKAKTICSGNGVIKALLPYQKGLFQVDFYRAQPSTLGIHLIVRTGSADHNMWLAGHAHSRGLQLKYSEGLIKDDKVIAGEDERQVFSALDLPFSLPQEREVVDGKPLWMHQKAN
jgi:DNA polymerase/3'-5' exonuclease PolX